MYSGAQRKGEAQAVGRGARRGDRGPIAAGEREEGVELPSVGTSPGKTERRSLSASVSRRTGMVNYPGCTRPCAGTGRGQNGEAREGHDPERRPEAHELGQAPDEDGTQQEAAVAEGGHHRYRGAGPVGARSPPPRTPTAPPPRSPTPPMTNPPTTRTGAVVASASAIPTAASSPAPSRVPRLPKRCTVHPVASLPTAIAEEGRHPAADQMGWLKRPAQVDPGPVRHLPLESNPSTANASVEPGRSRARTGPSGAAGTPRRPRPGLPCWEAPRRAVPSRRRSPPPRAPGAGDSQARATAPNGTSGEVDRPGSRSPPTGARRRRPRRPPPPGVGGVEVGHEAAPGEPLQVHRGSVDPHVIEAPGGVVDDKHQAGPGGRPLRRAPRSRVPKARTGGCGGTLSCPSRSAAQPSTIVAIEEPAPTNSATPRAGGDAQCLGQVGGEEYRVAARLPSRTPRTPRAGGRGVVPRPGAPRRLPAVPSRPRR